ncbi:MAG: hypothetical protein JWP34_1373 [Massilia sp.]|jgi:hypothetical protein|nr:hypothetical protein [Massilia sp.]
MARAAQEPQVMPGTEPISKLASSCQSIKPSHQWPGDRGQGNGVSDAGAH